jgi:ADP-ribose pyrophosphatase YjhB (NUDIX family)
MEFLYKTINSMRRIYWFIFRPHTQGVKCLIECNEEYLLIQTSYSGKYWTLPGGGVRRSESPEEATNREVREELGIMIVGLKEVGRYESNAEYKKDTIHLFYGSVSGKDFKPNAEVSKAQWFEKGSLPNEQSRALKESLVFILPLLS